MALGYGSPSAFQLGGGLTHYERVYLALRRAMGEGGAGPLGGVEDEWRKAKAMIIARAIALEERAWWQAFPGYATEQIGIWEGLLALPPADTLAERQRAAEAAYTKQLAFDVPTIRRDLQAIDPGLDVVQMTKTLSVTTQFGIPYEAPDGVPPFVNYSHDFVCAVIWTGLTDGIPDPATLDVVTRYLENLPAWIDWRIMNGVGFYLDGFNDSRLDLTAFDGLS